jgi:hypothetical protein
MRGDKMPKVDRYADVGAPRYVADVSPAGETLRLNDDSEWSVDPADRSKVMSLVTLNAVIRSAPDGIAGYLLICGDFDVRVRFEGYRYR